MVRPTWQSNIVTMAASNANMGSVIIDQYLAEQCSISAADKASGENED